MTILALEFSSDRRSVALARGGVVLAEAAQQTASRATDALGLIGKVLVDAKVLREEIEVIAVGLGPGSYTGIRAAIAVAQGWQLAFADPEHDIGGQTTAATAQRRLARGIKLLGVSSVEAMVAQAQAAKQSGRVNVAVDAQRGEFYLAAWEISAGSCTEILPLRIVAAAEVARLKAAGEMILGADFFPTAAAVARLAAGRNNFVAGGELQPVYLRETAFLKSPSVRAV